MLDRQKPKSFWSAGEIERRKLSDLKPYPNNPRTHTPEQVAQIAASMREFGFTQPMIIDEHNMILAGHGRAMASQSLGLVEVPVIVRAGLDVAQKKAIVIADNQIAANAGWDDALLRIEITELKKLDFDLKILGFDDLELVEFVTGLGELPGDPEEVPAPPVNPVTRTGDIWLLGNHRLLAGDATNAEDVAAVLAGAKPHLMVTDPPYGVDYDATWRVDRSLNATTAAGGKVQNDNISDWSLAYNHFGGDVAYAWSAGLRSTQAVAGLEAAGFEIRSQIIWVKQHLVIGRGDYHFKHEPCWYAVRKGKTGHWNGDRTQTTVWEIDKPQKSETGHSTQKPIECMRRPMLNNSIPGDDVYDPFSGSGTSTIAAEMTGRRCLAIEIDPTYVDVSVLRWQGVTSKTATLESTGQTFDAVKAERHKKPKKNASEFRPGKAD